MKADAKGAAGRGECGCRHFRWHIVAESVADSHVNVFRINIRDC